MSSQVPHSLDDLIRALGKSLRYQCFLGVLLATCNFLSAFNEFCIVFYKVEPSFFCKPSLNISRNDTNPILGMHHNEIIYDRCHMYINHSLSNETTTCTNGYEYFEKGRETTIVSEWDLVCDYDTIPQLAITIYFIGASVGSFVVGQSADRFGRKPLLLATMYLTVPFGIGIYFVKSLTGFLILRFVQGALAQGLQTVAYVMTMELFPPENRTAAGSVKRVFWAMGIMITALIGYLCEDWRYIQLAITLPALLTTPYFWIVPESVRWLVIQKKFRYAKRVMKRFNRLNNLKLTKEFFEGVEKIKVNTAKHYSFLDLYKTPHLRKHTFIMSYLCMSTSWVYYTLAMNVPMLSNNKYFNVFIGGGVEMPSYIGIYFILKKFGRRWPLFINFTGGGLACIIAGLLPEHTAYGTELLLPKTILTLVGRYLIVACYTNTYLYGTEIFPTVIRNVGLGMCSLFTRVGGIIAPLIFMACKGQAEYMPIIVAGIVAAFAAFLSLLLMETKNKQLTDTVEEAEILGHKKTLQELLAEYMQRVRTSISSLRSRPPSITRKSPPSKLEDEVKLEEKTDEDDKGICNPVFEALSSQLLSEKMNTNCEPSVDIKMDNYPSDTTNPNDCQILSNNMETTNLQNQINSISFNIDQNYSKL